MQTAHCTCMAGLGECCSHIAATLFCVETIVRLKKGITCTSMMRKWGGAPSDKVLGQIEYSEGANILFTSSQRKRKQEENNLAQNKNVINPLSEEEAAIFYKDLENSEKNETKPVKSAILSILPNHVERFIPTITKLALPAPLTNLFSKGNRSLSYDDLIKMCETVFVSIKITKEQVHCSFYCNFLPSYA